MCGNLTFQGKTLIIKTYIENEIELSNALHIVDEFGLYSGLKLNKTKTEALLIGSSKHNLQACIAGIKCATMVKALGVYFGHDKKNVNILTGKIKKSHV